MKRRRVWSDITVKDVFCGAGGNTIGAKLAGLRVVVALNHWDRAIETYGDNNPDVDVVERVDVSACDPRRYPSTNIGIFSPECTTHSPAGGNKHARPDWHPNLFPLKAIDPATLRSRVTMLDVIRFTEYHRYEIVIIENVVEATRWELFPDWLQMMHNLGYHHRINSFNSMFFHPTPQSRDRIYIVFWRKGNPEPNLEYRPQAPCAKCGTVRAVQAWKNDRTIGKYKRQYIYSCPSCAKEVTPFYYAALNALDFSLQAERIGDRSKPLKPRTMDRIRFVLEKYGRRPLVVNVKQGERDSSRAWPAEHRPLGSVPTWDNYFGLSQPSPFLVETAHTNDGERRASGLLSPAPTQSAQQSSALVTPFLVTLRTNADAQSIADPATAMCASGNHHVLVQGAPFVVTNRANNVPRGIDEALSPMNTGNHHMVVQGAPIIVPIQGNSRARSSADPLPTQLAECSHEIVIQGAAQISLRDADAMRVAGLDRELMTQGCSPQAALIQRTPFLVSQYGTHNASPLDRPVPSVTTVDRHELVQPGPILSVDDCYFRMLQPHEIGAAMAFPGNYVVGGNKRDRVKQYGNAVTPPVMDWIVRQCAATLAPELDQGVA
jgi:DNA (cytosine-5)-methyltransferase 1